MSGPDTPLRPDAEPRPADSVEADSVAADSVAADGVDAGVEEAAAADVPRRRRTRVKRRSWARRRHLGWITIGAAVLVLAAGLAVVVLTWDSGRTPPSVQAATAAGRAPSAGDLSAAPAPSATGGPVDATVRGQVTAVGDAQYTMETRSGLSYTVLVTPTTTFGKKTAFDDYPVGKGLAVVGTLDAGVLTATTISPAAAN